MIIDFHIHIGLKEHWHPWVNAHFQKTNPKLYENFEAVMDPDGLSHYLKQQGVDQAVVLAENSPITTGIVPNEFVRDFCKGRSEFIPFASVDPKIHDNPELRLRKLVTDWKFKGLKLYPSYQQYRPNDGIAYPLYKEAENLGIPVMVHTGSSVFRGSRLKYANPLYLDDVAVDFPDLKIILAHSGRGLWYEEAYFLARLHKNVYMEVSGLPPKKLLEYFPKLEDNSDRILFGSDWPGISSVKDNIDAVNALELKKSTKKKLLGENARSLLGMK